MKCYNCGCRVPDDRNTCPKCATDIRLYRKIIHASNQYYNVGLDRARARDLTGAAECLRTSIQLYKKNINARNLLGLVYYEMGEAALALKEWVISKNFRHRGNPADGYIQELRDNRQSLDSDDHSIRKFNQALEYAKNGSRDMAVIQLKKVISVNPRMLKAYQLLALLYMDDKKYDLAKTVVDHCLEIDRGNPSALSYKRELEKYRTSEKKQPVGYAGELEREEVIIPVRMRDYGTYLAAAGYIFLGFALALGVLYYVVMPGREKEITRQGQEVITEYENKYVSLNAEITGLETKLAELESSKNEEIEEHVQAESEANSLADAYRALLAGTMYYVTANYAEAPAALAGISEDATADPAYQTVYAAMKQQTGTALAERIFYQALFDREILNNRTLAIEVCEASLSVDPNYDQAIFFCGLCYQENGDNNAAVERYREYLMKFPTGIWSYECRTRLQVFSPETLAIIDSLPQAPVQEVQPIEPVIEENQPAQPGRGAQSGPEEEANPQGEPEAEVQPQAPNP